MIPAPAPPFLASFAMVPFCSRITAGRFKYRDRPVKLAQNFPLSLTRFTALNGKGWQIEHLAQNACTLVYEHDRDAAAGTGWPGVPLRQHFTICESGLTHSIRVKNVSRETMPVGAGFHLTFRLHRPAMSWRAFVGSQRAAVDRAGACGTG